MTKKTKKKATKKVLVPEVVWVPDESQRIAAEVLAQMGYSFGSGRRSGALHLAAEAANVHVNTVLNWVKKPEYSELVERERARIIARNLEALNTLATSGDVTAIIYRLKTLAPEQFDDQLIRLRAKHEMEKEMLRLEGEELAKAVANLPAPVYAELTEEQVRNVRDAA